MATNNYKFLDESGLGEYDGLLKQYISDRKTDIYAVVGTQTSSTAAWTGDLPLDALYDGLIIDYYIPYDVPSSTNVTLNLTLADGTTTGAIDVYVRAGRLTSHYCGGCSVMMTYYSAGSISVGGTATTNDRWLCDPYYDSNDTATICPKYGRPTVGGNGLNSSSICAMLSDGTFSSLTLESGTGTKTFDSTNYFDIREIFVYDASTVLSPGDLIIANTLSLSGTRFNMRYSFNGVTTSSATSSMQDNMPIYLVFDPAQSSGSCFKLKSPYYTQVPSDTSAIYVLVGYMSDSYRYDLWVYNPAFTWDGTKLIPYVKAALADEATHAADATTVSNHTVSADVPSGAVFTDTLNTTGSTDTSNKIYLVGATSQAANPQTYSDDEVYTTDGVLTTKSVQIGGGAASMVYDSTTQSINFTFT